ncbi:isoleucine--tRNA ligase, putative [Plasmodium ovale curtisi]|uniref:Isoleucine--tRNA ligase, putative n=1 Tax=Plasmodium ovale curtisi TaxID=864141 RepID=A0A1A8WBJ1_PLAOA|nr:isoleucine--tRNA ligase, putative [Plasmodium ovale curtisi]
MTKWFKVDSLLVVVFLIVELCLQKYISLYYHKKTVILLEKGDNISIPKKKIQYKQFIHNEKCVKKRLNSIDAHKKNIKDVIKESINLPVQLLPTTYDSFERRKRYNGRKRLQQRMRMAQKTVQELWNAEHIYDKRNLQNVKKCLYNDEDKNKLLNKCRFRSTSVDLPLKREEKLLDNLTNDNKKKIITNVKLKNVKQYMSSGDFDIKFYGKKDAPFSKLEEAVKEIHLHRMYVVKKKENMLKKLYEKTFKIIKIIHDGPPYANNDIHIGHILNKVVKDIYLRFLLLQNYLVILIHGFDTHGLPIEYNVMKMLKIKNVEEINLGLYPFSNMGKPKIEIASGVSSLRVMRKLAKKGDPPLLSRIFCKTRYIRKVGKDKMGKMSKSVEFSDSTTTTIAIANKDAVSPAFTIREKIRQFKKLCKLYASHFVNEQFMSLVSYGIWGLWKYSYVTFYKLYERIQCEVFRNLLKHNHVYMSNRPIYHSYETKTVLSDSEIIYKKRTCNSFYFFYSFSNVGDNLVLHILKDIKENNLIKELIQLTEEETQFCMNNFDIVMEFVNSIKEHKKGGVNGDEIREGRGSGEVTENSNSQSHCSRYSHDFLRGIWSKVAGQIMACVNILVFTTQMYTIFNNKCLLVHEDYLYRIVKVTYENASSNFFLISDKSFDTFIDHIKMYYAKKAKIVEMKTVTMLKGRNFRACTYRNFINGQENNFVFASKNEISEFFGSGIVHVAPSHGFTDYSIYHKNNPLKKWTLSEDHYDNRSLPHRRQSSQRSTLFNVHPNHSACVNKEKKNDFSLDVVSQNVIDENDNLKEEYKRVVVCKCKDNIHLIEKYENKRDKKLLLDSIQDGNNININQKDVHLLFFYAFYENIFFYFPYDHSYPYDWRSHTSVQVKSLLQIYVDIEKIKTNAFFNSIKKVKFMNRNVKNNMIKTIKDRNEWCISRQKFWGLNIPLKDLTLPNDKKISFKKQIMDVWFDSSISYLYVMYICRHIVLNVYLTKILQSLKRYGRLNRVKSVRRNKFASGIVSGGNSARDFFNIRDVYKEILKRKEHGQVSGSGESCLLKNIVEKKKIFDPLKMYKWVMEQVQHRKNVFRAKNIRDIIFPNNSYGIGCRNDIWHGDDSARTVKQFFKPFHIHLCCEGIDQIRGWFQSFFFIYFFLNSITWRGKSVNVPKNFLPIKNVIVHNYVVDRNNVKMSKSLNNVISPRELFFELEKKCSKSMGGNNASLNSHEKVPKREIPQKRGGTPSRDTTTDSMGMVEGAKKRFNADIVRLWICCYNFVSRNISISYEILENVNKYIYLKIYNTLKFLLNNIYDLNMSEKKIQYSELQIMDKYILHKEDQLIKHCSKAYKTFQLQLLVKYILNFIHRDLAIYIDYSKDRLYIHKKDSLNRKNCQRIFYKILIDMLILLAPVIPHLCEDVYRIIQRLSNNMIEETIQKNEMDMSNVAGKKWKSIFMLQFPKFKNYKEINMDILFLLKYYVHKQLSIHVSNSLQAVVYFYSDNIEIVSLIKSFLKTPDPLSQFNNYDDLRFLFNVSNIFWCNDLNEMEKADKNYKTYKIPLLTNSKQHNIGEHKSVDDFFQASQKHTFKDMFLFDENAKHAYITIGIEKSSSRRCSRCWMFGTVSSFEGEFFCPRCLNVVKTYYS